MVFNFEKTKDSLSGPVAIVAVGAEVARSDVAGLFQFAAILNINLAVINILPLPVWPLQSPCSVSTAPLSACSSLCPSHCSGALYSCGLYPIKALILITCIPCVLLREDLYSAWQLCGTQAFHSVMHGSSQAMKAIILLHISPARQ